VSTPTQPTSSAPVVAAQPRIPERPTGAFVCGVIGGVAILVAGVLEIDVGASCRASGCSYFFGGASSIYIASGILGAVVGTLALVFAALSYVHPEHRVVSGVMLIVLSILSLISFWGGFGVGFIATLLAGILAIVWQPGPRYLGYQPVFAPPYPYPAPVAPDAPRYAPVPAVAPAPIQRVCLKCGWAVDPQAKFCSRCGNTLA
jgi:hypothetical protein